MSREEYLLVLLGMGIVTYLPRWLPLLTLSRRKLPQGVIDWLGFVPATLLAALVAPPLLIDEASLSLTLGKADLWVALPTFLFALKTRSLAGTVLVGMALFWGAGQLF